TSGRPANDHLLLRCHDNMDSWGQPSSVPFSRLSHCPSSHQGVSTGSSSGCTGPITLRHGLVTEQYWVCVEPLEPLRSRTTRATAASPATSPTTNLAAFLATAQAATLAAAPLATSLAAFLAAALAVNQVAPLAADNCFASSLVSLAARSINRTTCSPC